MQSCHAGLELESLQAWFGNIRLGHPGWRLQQKGTLFKSSNWPHGPSLFPETWTRTFKSRKIMAQTYPSCLSPERTHSHLNFLADLPSNGLHPPPKQSMPLQAFGGRNGTYLPSPWECEPYPASKVRIWMGWTAPSQGATGAGASPRNEFLWLYDCCCGHRGVPESPWLWLGYVMIPCECQQQLLCCDLKSGNVKPLTVLQCDV